MVTVLSGFYLRRLLRRIISRNLLEVSIERFRTILNELPMSDAEIAKDLGISQTKVMNIRRAVRERLARRRREFLDEGISDSVRLK